MNDAHTGMIITVLGQIGEPADLIREYLASIETDAPAIQGAVRDALANL
jgi:hypothetical protein